MTGYSFHLTCPYDGAPIQHVTGGVTNGWETRAIARCTQCNTQLLIAVAVTAPNGARRATPAKRAQLAKVHAARKVPA